MASRLSEFLAEVRRRKVYRAAAVYATVGTAISLAVPDLFSAFDLPTSAARLVIVLIVIGFPVALALAWAFEVTPEGKSEVEGTEAEEKAPEDTRGAGTGEGATLEPDVLALPEGTVITVLPFTNMNGNPGDEVVLEAVVLGGPHPFWGSGVVLLRHPTPTIRNQNV